MARRLLVESDRPDSGALRVQPLPGEAAGRDRRQDDDRARLPTGFRRSSLAEVWIATDDERIFEAAEGFGGRVVMTRSDHPSGTDRLAEAAASMDADVVVNIQGDEPLLDPAEIDAVVAPFAERPGLEMTTAAVPILSPVDDPQTPGIVRWSGPRGLRALLLTPPDPFPSSAGGRSPGASPKHIASNAYTRKFR